MDEPSTLNNLVLYLYNETEMSDTVLIQQTIDCDDDTAELFEDLKSAKQLIETTLLSPRRETIANILAYAQLTAPLQATA